MIVVMVVFMGEIQMKYMVLLLVLLTALTGCSLSPEYYTVNFDSDGGSYTPSAQHIEKDRTVVEPMSPDKASTRGFMYWATEDGKPYDFSTPVVSSFTLKAVYWPANVISSSADSSEYNVAMNKVKDEVLCLHYLVRKLVGTSELMSGSTDFKSIFNDNNELVAGILRNALQSPDYVMINGENISVTNSDLSYSVLWDECSVETNTTKTYTDSTTTKYTLDITGLKIKIKYFLSGEDWVRQQEQTADIAVKGTFIKSLDNRCEFHVQLSVNENEYPVLHAIVEESGTDNVIFFYYKGLSSYIPDVKL